MNYKYFKDSEFRRCNPACSLSDMDSSFMKKLDLIRECAGIPFVINSAFRSIDYELSKGRKGTSSHCKGVAVDIRCNDSFSRYLIIRAACLFSVNRIGVHRNFIHIDCDYSKPGAIWLY